MNPPSPVRTSSALSARIPAHRGLDRPLPLPRRISVDPGVLRALEPYFRSPARGQRFHNPWPHESRRGLLDVLRWKLGGPGRRACAPVPVHEHALRDFQCAPGPGRLLWLGHASFLAEIDGVRFMLDPIFGSVAGLIRRVTPVPFAVSDIPSPQVVLLTHGHSDHTDPASLRTLCQQAEQEITFIVPRGLSRCLPACCSRVIELSWWESVTLDGVEFLLVPAQHWHRRGIADEDACLWGGYIARGSCSLYHSGDTAFFGGFEAIGCAVPRLDVACLPLGAYEPRWFMAGQHMAPEHSLMAFQHLRAQHFVGMHWGTYDLSDEPIDAGPALLRSLLGEPAAPDPGRIHVLRPGGVLSFGGRAKATAFGRFA